MSSYRSARTARLLVACAATSSACASEIAPAARQRSALQAPARSQDTKPQSGLEVSGLRGTLAQEDIERVMEGRLGGFQRCFMRGLKDIPALSGDILFAFVVDPGGRVSQVEVIESSFGHLSTEHCMRDKARKARFPKPAGGAPAEFSWGFGIDPPEDTAPATPVAAERIDAETPAVLESAAACGVSGALVTAYIDQRGKPLAVGVSAGSGADATRLQCVVDEVAKAELPAPAEGTGKVSFAVP